MADWTLFLEPVIKVYVEKKDFASCEVSNRYRHRKDQSDSGFQDCVFVEVQSWLKEDGPVSPVC